MRHAGWVIALTIAGCGGGSSVDDAAVVHDGPVDGPPDVATLVVAPSTVDFGAVSITTTSAMAQVVVTNAGVFPTAGAITTVLGGAAPDQFTVVSSCGTLAVHATCTLAVRFAPTTLGTHTASLTVTDGQTSAVVSLSGVGLTVEGLTISPSTHDFGPQPLGFATAPTVFTIANTGATTTGVPVISVTGTNDTAFGIESSTCSAGLAAGASCTLGVYFQPTTAGIASATLTYAASPGGTVSASLIGTGLAGTAAITISPASIAFADTGTGQTSSTSTVTVSNLNPFDAGAITLVKGGMDPTQFSIVSTTCTTLPAGQSCTFGVAFTPSAAGAKIASVAAVPATGGSASVALSGTAGAPALLAIAPAAHDFGAASIGTNTAPIAFTVTNTGGVATGGVTASLSGPSATQFAITASTCTGTLAPAATCTISARFSPSVNGNDTASLVVAASPGGTASATLTGLGASGPPIMVSPSAADFGPVPVGSASAPTVFTVTNTSTVPTGALTASVTGTAASAFQLTANTCNTLAPGATCTVAVVFTPTATVQSTATLLISGSPGGNAVAALFGTGT